MNKHACYLYIIFLIGMIACCNVHGFLVDQVPSKEKHKSSLSSPFSPNKVRFKKSMVLNKPLTPFFIPVKSPFKNEVIATDPFLLQKAAADALHYIEHNYATHQNVISPSDFDKNILSSKDVKRTLQYIISIIEEDKKTGFFRILDPVFVSKHFQCIKWLGDTKSAQKNNECFVEKNKIRLTHYLAYRVKGSYVQSEQYPCALYQLNKGVKPLHYTKQEVLGGILEEEDNQKKVNPLVWVTREALEEAIMQGLIIVIMPDSKMRAFNVDHNNGIEYDKKIKNPLKQGRYWYFREIRSKYVENFIKRIAKRKNVIFAGDIFNIGMGKVLAISYKNPKTKKSEMRLGILADTGGAFVKNLYKLDFFAGIFSSRRSFNQHLSNFTNMVDAYILSVRK